MPPIPWGGNDSGGGTGLYLGALATYGQNATPSQRNNSILSTEVADNSSPITLSGTLQTIATFSTIAYDGSTNVMLWASVAFTDGNGQPGSLVVDIQDGSTSVIGTPVEQDLDANGTVISLSILVRPAVGSHTYNVKARLGDGSLATGTVDAHHGWLVGLNTKA